MKHALGAMFLAAGLAACASTVFSDTGPTDERDPRPPRPAPELGVGAEALSGADEGPGLLQLGTIGGEPLSARAVLSRLVHRESRLVFDTVDRLVSARLALAEANRLGIRLGPEVVDQALTDAKSEIEVAIGQVGVDLDRWLVENLGLEPGRYFDQLRDEVIEELLAERAIRAWTLSTERCELSVILVEDEELARDLRGRLEAGEAFADLAREHSQDTSAAAGGRIPPIVRNELAPLARIAFRTEVGAVSGPVEEQGGWLLLRVDARPAPLAGPWTEVGQAVESDLASEPVQDPEYWQWRAAMERRYLVDLTPMIELTGGQGS